MKLLLTEAKRRELTDRPQRALLFETISAFGRALLVLAMFVGRIGPLALAFSIGSRRSVASLAYPEEDIAVG
ncbi:MAG: hypothetical protein ACOX5G_09540 [Kiritimatiellia bacterium]|jgi:trk system potassium uptake protein TrkH